MAARHEAPARDILEIHADSFMAVYGYRKTHAQLLARGWDPAEIGRDQVIERHAGIRSPRRAPRQDPVATKPAKGTGGRPDLVERGFEAEAPNRLHVADITYVRMANGSFGYGVRHRRVRPQDRRMGVRHHHGHRRSCRCRRWNRRYHGASAGGADGLMHHSDHGAQYISLSVHHQGQIRVLPSAGTVGDSYDNAHGRERRRRVQDRARLAAQALPGFEDLELATFRWVSWWGLEASAPVLGLQDTGTDRNRVLCKPSGASLPHYKGGTKNQAISVNRPYRCFMLDLSVSITSCYVRYGWEWHYPLK